MDDYQTRLLEYAMAAGVLILANQIQSQKRAQGVKEPGDCMSDAVALLDQKSATVFELLSVLM